MVGGERELALRGLRSRARSSEPSADSYHPRPRRASASHGWWRRPFRRSAPDATVLSGSCLPYGEGITFWPVLEVVRQWASPTTTPRQKRREASPRHLRASDSRGRRRRVAELIGSPRHGVGRRGGLLGRAQAVRDSRPAAAPGGRIRRPPLGRADAARPGGARCGRSRDAPLLFLAMARHELLELRPGWGAQESAVT